MGQKKLQRFADIKNFSNVLEYPVAMQGKWNSFFKNDHPIVLELACGRGEYTVGLSALFSEKNFIGVDVKGNRMYMPRCPYPQCCLSSDPDYLAHRLF